MGYNVLRKRTNNYLGRNLSKKREEDRISKEDRSNLMSKIRSKNTKFEQRFILELKKYTKNKFETNIKELKGKPDIVFKKYNLCVFLDSDFWHGWQYPRWKHLLKNDFWRSKIEANRKRDKKNTQHLKRNGWNVIRIWEHNINKDITKEIERILKVINNA